MDNECHESHTVIVTAGVGHRSNSQSDRCHEGGKVHPAGQLVECWSATHMYMQHKVTGFDLSRVHFSS